MSKLLPLDLYIRQALLYPLDSPFLPPENKVLSGYSFAAGRKTGSLISEVILDLFEYPNNAAAQLAYVSSERDTIDQQQITTTDNNVQLGDIANNEYRPAQSFQLSATLLVSKVEVYFLTTVGSPPGNVTVRIETDAGGILGPSGTLADANAISSGITITQNDWNTFSFSIPFYLTGSTKYWIRMVCDNQATGVYWKVALKNSSGYTDGNYGYFVNGSWVDNVPDADFLFKVYVVNLQCYSEDTIVQQGTYSLKGIAKATDSLNNTLTRTLLQTLNLTGKNTWVFYIRSSRTGSNIKVGLHDSGGVTTEVTPNIITINTWQKVEVDISSVADADKNTIDRRIITIVDAGADNVFHFDNMKAA